MPDRAAEVAAALDAAGLAGWQATALPADASRRRYLRLTRDGESRIVMDAPPESGEALEPFLAIAAHLRGLGLAAPAVHLADPALGLAVLEDLGPRHAADHLRRDPGDEAAIYTTAAAVLARLQAAPPPPGLAVLDPGAGVAMLAPLFDHAAPGTDPSRRAALEVALHAALAAHAPGPPVLSLRDFHAENLVWRPERTGTDRLGLLDFQDAFLAPPAYDLASLLDDARRDVAPGTEAAVLEDFAALTGGDPGALARARAVLSVQRNLRILGIFARLIHRDGKTRYRAFLPRVLRHLRRHLADPALAAVALHALPLVAAAEGAP